MLSDLSSVVLKICINALTLLSPGPGHLFSIFATVILTSKKQYYSNVIMSLTTPSSLAVRPPIS